MLLPFLFFRFRLPPLSVPSRFPPSLRRRSRSKRVRLSCSSKSVGFLGSGFCVLFKKTVGLQSFFVHCDNFKSSSATDGYQIGWEIPVGRIRDLIRQNIRFEEVEEAIFRVPIQSLVTADASELLHSNLLRSSGNTSIWHIALPAFVD